MKLDAPFPVWRRHRISVLVLALTTAQTALGEPPVLRPVPGVRYYRYESTEQVDGQVTSRYRMNFDLVTGRHRSVVAVVRRAEIDTGEGWTEATLDDQCAKLLHGGGGALARVTLHPLSKRAAEMGDAFMPMCTPAALFFPMTDILNVSGIQTEPLFRVTQLSEQGNSVRWPGRAPIRLNRFGSAITLSSPPGTITLSGLDKHKATVDWIPDVLQIEIVHQGQADGPDVLLRGTENHGYRLEIDSVSGTLIRAETTVDDLDLSLLVPGIPEDKRPRVATARQVVIESPQQ